MNAPVTRRLRRSARIVLLDAMGRVLLFRYDAPGFAPFWILPGGECDEGEDFAQAAVRELLEETGIRACPVPAGIVREAEYEFLGEPVRSVEHFFWLRTREAAIDTTGHTALEQEVMQEYRWFTGIDIAGWHETIYPLDLRDLAERLARGSMGDICE